MVIFLLLFLSFINLPSLHYSQSQLSCTTLHCALTANYSSSDHLTAVCRLVVSRSLGINQANFYKYLNCDNSFFLPPPPTSLQICHCFSLFLSLFLVFHQTPSHLYGQCHRISRFFIEGFPYSKRRCFGPFKHRGDKA